MLLYPFNLGLCPLHSPLLGTSFLVSFPGLNDMLKFSPWSRFKRCRLILMLLSDSSINYTSSKRYKYLIRFRSNQSINTLITRQVYFTLPSALLCMFVYYRRSLKRSEVLTLSEHMHSTIRCFSYQGALHNFSQAPAVFIVLSPKASTMISLYTYYFIFYKEALVHPFFNLV